MTKSQIFFWLLVAFLVGVAVASFIPISLPGVWVIFIVGAALIGYGLVSGENKKRTMVIGFAFVIAAFGMFRFLIAVRVPDSMLDPRVGIKLEIKGVIRDEPVRNAKNQQSILTTEPKDRVLLITPFYPEFRYGDRIRVTGELRKPDNFSDSFDYRAYLAKDDIYYMMSFPTVERVSSNQASQFFSILLGVKHAFSRKLNQSIPEPQASFMAGLILGERRSLPQEITDELQTTGTSHIVALSGYNITIIADALMKMLALAAVPFSWAFFVAVLGILAFTAITGAAASVVRASIMGILVLIARRVGRRYQVRNALTLAASLMLLQNPRIFRFDIGFELSFLATLGLVYGSPLIERAYERMKLRLIPPLRDAKIVKEDRDARAPMRRTIIRSVLISTLAAQMFVLPLLVYQFGKLSLVSPLANLAVLPFIPLTMLLGFLTGVLALLSGPLGLIVGWISWLFLSYELNAISFFSRVPFAAIHISGIAPAVVAGVYLLGVILIWKRIRNVRH